MRNLIRFPLLLLLSLLLAACGAGGGTTSGTTGSTPTSASAPTNPPDNSSSCDPYSCIMPSPTAGGNASCTPSGFTLGVETFCADMLTLPKGGTITFKNDPASGTPHYLVIGKNGMAETEQGAPSLGATPRIISPGQSFTTGAWNTPGTYHISCQIHPTTMNLTITVTG